MNKMLQVKATIILLMSKAIYWMAWKKSSVLGLMLPSEKSETNLSNSGKEVHEYHQHWESDAVTFNCRHHFFVGQSQLSTSPALELLEIVTNTKGVKSFQDNGDGHHHGSHLHAIASQTVQILRRETWLTKLDERELSHSSILYVRQPSLPVAQRIEIQSVDGKPHHHEGFQAWHSQVGSRMIWAVWLLPTTCAAEKPDRKRWRWLIK